MERPSPSRHKDIIKTTFSPHGRVDFLLKQHWKLMITCSESPQENFSILKKKEYAGCSVCPCSLLRTLCFRVRSPCIPLTFTLTSSRVVCLWLPACHPGFYKAFAGNIKCSKCPPHSYSYGEGAAICRCEKGFYRADKDPPTMACTRKYFKWHD